MVDVTEKILWLNYIGKIMNIYKKLAIILILMTFGVPCVYSIDDDSSKVEQKQNTESVITLKDCISKALNNSPKIRRAKINYEMAKKNVKLAQSVYFPTISAGAGYDFSNREGSKIQSSTGNTFNVRAGISQLIWNFGKTSANIKMQKFNRIVAAYDFDTMVLDTIFDVKVKYYSALAAKAGIEINEANLQINERNYQRTKAYFEEGLKSKIDLVNAEVYVTDAKVSLISTENLYKNSLSALNNSMYLAYNPEYNIEVPKEFRNVKDMTPKSLTDFSKPLDELLAPPKNIDNALLSGSVDTTDYASLYQFKKFPYNFEKCLEIANKNRPDIKAYENTIKAMEQYVNVIKRQYFPELTANGSYNFNGGKTNSNSSTINTFGAGINLTSSLNIMSEKYQIDNAKLQLDLAQNELDMLKQNVYFEVQQAYINMMEFEEQIPLLEQKIKQTLENLELADGRYSVGLGDYIELQDAKVNYNNAQHAFVKAVFNYNVAKAKLEQSIAMEQEVTVKLEGK